MTDPTQTLAEVERFGCDQLGMDKMPDGEWVRFTDYQALRERAEAAEKRAYDLAVAIIGGEDAPGYADSIPTQVLVDQQREMASEWLHRVTPEHARRAEAAAWNDAIEAAASVYLNGANPNTWDYFSLARHEIRALRRAAPTEGEA